MKKIIKVLLSAFLFVGIAACGNNEDAEKQAVKEVVDNYFTAVQSGDYKKAMEYYTDDADDGYEILQLDEMLEEELTNQGLGDDFDNAAKDWVTSTVKKLFKTYEVGDITLKDDTATVQLTGQAINLEGLNNTDDLNTRIEEATNNYMTEHYDELVQIYNDNDEDTAQGLVVKALAEFLFGELDSYVDTFDYADYESEMTLVKQDDGSYKISKTTISQAEQG